MYLCGYVLLDKLSATQALGSYGITPWTPSAGLGFLLVLLCGRRMLPLLFLAPLLSGLTNSGLSLPAWLAAVEAGVIGSGYAVATTVLLRPETKFNASLISLHDVFVLLGVALISSTAVASTFAGILLATNHLPTADFTSAALRYWVGDMTGIATIVPFGLLAATRERFPLPDWRTASQVALIALALAVAVGSARNQQLQLYFLLFLPITWIAVSSGLEGVSIALLMTQFGVIAALLFCQEAEADITALQARMVVLTATGLVAGALVTETRRAEQRLRENQAAITRLSRLGSMGELAIAIAHEVNQPLSAAGTYSRLVTESLATETLKDPTIIQTAEKATAQVERAAVVIRRLRAFVRLGRSELAATTIKSIALEAIDLVRPVLERSNISIRLEVDDALPPVLADRVQVGQVLINLLRNSAEAIAGAAMGEGLISVTASKANSRFAEISVCDNGPGFPAGFAETGPTLFLSDKADGLGVGLSLCRSIIESHGGDFRIKTASDGACVNFTLPFAEVSVHDS